MCRGNAYGEELKMVFYKILLFIGIALGVFGQMLLKRGMKRNISFRKGEIIRTLFRLYLNFFIIAGALCYAVSVILFIVVISHIDLSYAYPIVSMNFVFVSILSKLIFKERISKLRWFSMFVVMCGVILITVS